MSSQDQLQERNERLRQILREAGLRCTAARLTVMQQLDQANQPQSHKELVDELSLAGFDRTTLYRNLIELEKANLLKRVELGDHVSRFELSSRHEEHAGGDSEVHHLCTHCGVVTCLPDVKLVFQTEDQKIPPSLGEVSEILVKGTCPQCKDH
ncbi:Transcriptional repressor [Planctomycetales bacterium 10988]|nr:Transcriptional repressor [Planctomycetales bacterium 10988]